MIVEVVEERIRYLVSAPLATIGGQLAQQLVNLFLLSTSMLPSGFFRAVSPRGMRLKLSRDKLPVCFGPLLGSTLLNWALSWFF